MRKNVTLLWMAALLLLLCPAALADDTGTVLPLQWEDITPGPDALVLSDPPASANLDQPVDDGFIPEGELALLDPNGEMIAAETDGPDVTGSPAAAVATPAPGTSKENRLAVKYYLTEQEMGVSESEIAQYLRSIIKDYNLGAPGTYFLCSSLDTAYPDERATLTVGDGKAGITGPYFSRDYAITFP